jgi:predicted AlkP superfamily pyrophosphatase or phosphodiesterase
MVSIDGLKPEYVLQADAHGLKIPTLRSFLTRGAYAEGVVGVVPTVTYPSHTTLVTGVWPAEHGILANVTFDPLLDLESWYWYAQDVKVPTLWDVAKQAGIVTASVSWPVTVDSRSIEYLIPEYWRTRTLNDHKLLDALSRPVGWLRDAEGKLGPYNESSIDAVEADRVRTKFALEILRTAKPGFMTIHLAALDHLEHITGPFSKESDQTLESIDQMIGSLRDAVLANDPSATVVIVSDHGFAPVNRRVNLVMPFIKEGLIRTKAADGTVGPSRIVSWDAAFWPAGGCAAVVLRNPEDVEVKTRVKKLLLNMKTDPTYGIARVIEQPELSKMGGFPGATFLVEMSLGSEAAWAQTGPFVTVAPGTGTHGYLPDRPGMRASFFISGAGIAAGRDLGLIDMRQIAPTIANILNVNLPAAKAERLPVLQ